MPLATFACTWLILGERLAVKQLLGQVSANKFAQINYVIPLLGYGCGLLFMGETLRWHAVLAAVMIILGVRALLSHPQRQ